MGPVGMGKVRHEYLYVHMCERACMRMCVCVALSSGPGRLPPPQDGPGRRAWFPARPRPWRANITHPGPRSQLLQGFSVLQQVCLPSGPVFPQVGSEDSGADSTSLLGTVGNEDIYTNPLAQHGA